MDRRVFLREHLLGDLLTLAYQGRDDSAAGGGNQPTGNSPAGARLAGCEEVEVLLLGPFAIS